MVLKLNRDKILAGYPTKLAKNPPFHSFRSRLGKDTNMFRPHTEDHRRRASFRNDFGVMDRDGERK